ncbi:MAG: hypothetical protein ACRCT1_22290, partial [Microcoleaceae cyanobacterium]
EGRRKKEEGRRKKEEEAIKLMLGVINNVKYSRFLYILYKNKPSFGKKLGLFVFRQNPEDEIKFNSEISGFLIRFQAKT